MSALLQCRNLCKSYQDGEATLNILQDVSFSVEHGETLAILGASGSGKSTLLHILGTLDKADSGEICFEQQDLSAIKANKQASFRNQNLGFVYQFHHLLPEFNARENVAMPAFIAGKDKTVSLQQADELLHMVGLSSRISHRPSQLSGGERQRVAIARALINRPKLILADEPTGALDEDNSQGIFELLKDINKTHETTIVLVTHDHGLAAKMQRKIHLEQGRVVEAPK